MNNHLLHSLRVKQEVIKPRGTLMCWLTATEVLAYVISC